MKKIEYYLVLTLITVLFTSCFEEKDNWYTNTKEYDGRYVVSTTCDGHSLLNKLMEAWGEDEIEDETVIKDGLELLIYNSATNVVDEIIIDTHLALNFEEAPFPVKGKFKVTGNPANFSGVGTTMNLGSADFNTDDDGEFFIIYDPIYEEYYEPGYFFGAVGYPDGLPDALGEEWDAIQLYTRLSIETGQITSLGATTIGGNKSDAVSLKITMYHDYLVVESYETDPKTWVIPSVPEYGWRIKAGSRTNADGEEEKWTLTGYRYTGYPEDNPNTQPPITVK